VIPLTTQTAEGRSRSLHDGENTSQNDIRELGIQELEMVFGGNPVLWGVLGWFVGEIGDKIIGDLSSIATQRLCPVETSQVHLRPTPLGTHGWASA
jgi:hypothetical protein